MDQEQEQTEQPENDVDDAMRESAEVTGPVSRERANRFYDRMRNNIRRYLDDKGKVVSTAGEYLLLAPDIFVLLWRLVNDSRIKGADKALLGSGIAYYLFPLDFMPEAFLGPIGYLDDLVFAVYLLNRVLNHTDVEVLREHWSGKDDILETIRKVLNSADELVGKEFLSKLKK